MEDTDMKKILMISATIVVLAGLCVAASAACGGNKAVVNTTQVAVTGLSGTPGNVYSRLWDFGSGASINSGVAMAAKSAGASCGSIDNTADAWEMSGCAGAGYAIIADLIDAGQFVNGCPANGDRMVILLEDNTGKYAVISKIGSNGTWDLDQVATQAAVSYPTIKNITRTSAAGVSPVVFDVALQGLPANGYGGYAAADGAATVITGYNIYYQNAAAPPTPVLPGAWTLATNGTIAGATTASATGVQAPLPSSGQNMYLLLSMTFDYGESTYLPSVFTSFGPTASPLFANVTADPTTVAWTSGDESRVASYQAYMSLTQNGTYRAIGQPVAALGSGHSYTVNYRVVAPTYYVKIKASKTDGTFVWSSAVKVTRLAPAPKPLPGKAGLRK
jgi:hypothetical protein